jgi:SAM-dependent methyltransferase
LADCLAWQETTTPRPNFYFRWHLPRLATTCQFVAAALSNLPAARILDLGTFPPFAILLERFLSGRGGLTWTRTAFESKTDVYTTSAQRTEIPLTRCVLGPDPLPFGDAQFDLVMLTEVIEHVDAHPQLLLAEISRLLAPGGRLLLTTPNAASLKKLIQLSSGVPRYDSPTFGNAWGHRYEYSYYDMRQCIRSTAFAILEEQATDVYFDDPRGLAPTAELGMCLAGKLLTGQVRQAARMLARRGSTLFFIAAKTDQPIQAELLAI